MLGTTRASPSAFPRWPTRFRGAGFRRGPELGRWPGAPKYCGRFLDGFGNRMTVHAVSNPHRSGIEPAALHDRAAWLRHRSFSAQDARRSHRVLAPARGPEGTRCEAVRGLAQSRQARGPSTPARLVPGPPNSTSRASRNPLSASSTNAASWSGPGASPKRAFGFRSLPRASTSFSSVSPGRRSSSKCASMHTRHRLRTKRRSSSICPRPRRPRRPRATRSSASRAATAASSSVRPVVASRTQRSIAAETERSDTKKREATRRSDSGQRAKRRRSARGEPPLQTLAGARCGAYEPRA